MAKIVVVNNETRKEVITKKAAKLFKEKGFSATTMRDIAEAIGIEAPSLYNHISSKKEILQQVCSNVANLFTAFINKVQLKPEAALNKLDLIIRFHITMMLQEYDSVYVCDHEWKHLPEPYLSTFKTQRRNYRNRLADIVELGISNNEIKNIDPYVAVLTILSAIGGIEYWQRSKKLIDANMLEENMVKFLIGGLQNDQSLFNHKVVHLKS